MSADDRYPADSPEEVAFELMRLIAEAEEKGKKVSVLARGGIWAVSARRAECPIRWIPARA